MVVQWRSGYEFCAPTFLLEGLCDGGFYNVKLRHAAHEEKQGLVKKCEEAVLWEDGRIVPAEGGKGCEEVGEEGRL